MAIIFVNPALGDRSYVEGSDGFLEGYVCELENTVPKVFYNG